MMENKCCKENKGCITCRKCEQVRINFYCGRRRLTQKQLYKPGFCSKYEPREQAKEKPMTKEEWFISLSTEEKAKEIYKIAKDDFKELRKQFYGVANDDIDAIAMWLKEKHEC